MSRSATRFKSLFIGLVFLRAISLGSETLESILAIVDERPVFLSEVRALEHLRGVPRNAALEMLIDESLMYREALRFLPVYPTPQEMSLALQSLRLQSARAADLSESDLNQIVKRQSTILKYVDERLKPQIRPDPAAVQRIYQEEYAIRPDTPALESVSDEIEQRFHRRELDLKIEAWVRSLRQSSRIRYNEVAAESDAP
jgi:hypothetical protein